MNMSWLLSGAALLSLCVTGRCYAVDVDASPAQGMGVTVYDTGVSMVRERRLVNLAAGPNRVSLAGVPDSLEVASVSFSPPASVMGVQLLSLQLRHDLASVARALAGYQQSIVTVTTAERQYTGRLMHVREQAGDILSVALATTDGSVEVIKWQDVVSVNFPAGDQKLSAEPVLLWEVDSEKSQVQNFRVNYAMRGLLWKADYDLLLNSEGNSAALEARFLLENHTGMALEGARLRLIATEQGLAMHEQLQNDGIRQRISGRREYVVGADMPQSVTPFDGLSPTYTHDMAQPVDLNDEERKYYQYLSVERMPVERSYVYDGVVFDQYQRNRRTDWNYGTESKPDVDVYVEFVNDDRVGRSNALAPGRMRMLLRADDNTVDLLGEVLFRGIPAGEKAGVRLGPAKGLRGSRERIGYSEVVPLHEYEETFEIQLENNTGEDVTIRVIEHLYRWSTYDIVRADADYRASGIDEIEFAPVVKAGGSRSIRYTVRYRW